MTLPRTEAWYQAVKGWRIRRLRPLLPYYRAVLHAAYNHQATWKSREDWAAEFACGLRTVTKWNRVLRDYYLLLCGFEKQTPTGEPARNPNGVYVLRPVDPAEAKKSLDECGPITRQTEKKGRRKKRKRNPAKNVQVDESGTTTGQAPLDASEIVNLDMDVHRKLLPSEDGSSPTRPNTWECRITEDAFSAQSTPPVEVPAPVRSPKSLDAQKKSAADYKYLSERKDYSADDKMKVWQAACYLRDVEKKRGRLAPPPPIEAQEIYDEVTTSPNLNALLVEVLKRDSVPIESTPTPPPAPSSHPAPGTWEASRTWKEATSKMVGRKISYSSAESRLGKSLVQASIEEIDALGREGAHA